MFDVTEARDSVGTGSRDPATHNTGVPFNKVISKRQVDPVDNP